MKNPTNLHDFENSGSNVDPLIQVLGLHNALADPEDESLRKVDHLSHVTALFLLV